MFIPRRPFPSLGASTNGEPAADAVSQNLLGPRVILKNRYVRRVFLCSRGKTRGRQGGRGWVATNSGRYGMAGLPGTASLEPR